MRSTLIMPLILAITFSETPFQPFQAPSDANRIGAAAPSISFVIGQVRDGRNRTGTTVVPDGLPAVTGARVEIPTLGLATTTDARGRFRIENISVPAGAPYQKVSVIVTRAGFGTWQMTGAPVRPAGHYLELFIELTSAPVSGTYVPPEERPRRGTSVAAAEAIPSIVSSAGGHLAHPLADGCAAGGTFTGYLSQTLPPGSIRVWRRSTGTNRVDLVNFLFYAKKVLPNEWFPTDDQQALRAGAVAVKMYGWQRVNTANTFAHVLPTGECYDVDDTQTFQVYDERVSDPNTDLAVASTWPVVVYRAGTVLEALYANAAVLNATTGCVRFDGIHMVQEGTQTCATQIQQPQNRTLSWFEILQRFYDNISITFMGAGPAVTAPQSGLRIDVFVRGSDGQVHQKFWDCTTTPCSLCWQGCWKGPADGMGGLPAASLAVSDPAAAWSNNGTRLDVAVRGNDNAVWLDTFIANIGWSGWQSLGGDITAGPGLAAQRNLTQVDLLWRNSSNNVERTTFNGASWAFNGQLPALPTIPDASAVWDPAGTWRLGNTTLEAFVSSNDDGEQIFQSTLTGSTWGAWVGRGTGSDPAAPIGGNQARPSATAQGSVDRIDLFTRGSSNTLQWRHSAGTTWSAWSDLGTPTDGQIESGGGATWWQGDAQIDVFVRGRDGHLWQRQSTDGTNWGAWNDLGLYP